MSKSNNSNAPALTLYQRPTCPYCIRVKHTVKKLGIKIGDRNITSDHKAQTELIKRGGKRQVPALKIVQHDGEEKWLYESSAIVKYLDRYTSA